MVWVKVHALVELVPVNPHNHPLANDGASSSAMPDHDLEASIKAIQSDLRGYIISISGQGDDCDDILQETNIFLWERRADFQPGTNFKAWAFKVAYFKTMAYRRDRVRRGEVVFSETTTQRISTEASTHTNDQPDKLGALQRCLSKLSPDELRLIKIKYQQRKSLASFALQAGKSVDAIYKSISRIRQGLRACVQKELSSKNH